MRILIIIYRMQQLEKTSNQIVSTNVNMYACKSLNRRGPEPRGIIVIIILLLIITPLLRGYRVAGSFQCNKNVNLA